MVPTRWCLRACIRTFKRIERGQRIDKKMKNASHRAGKEKLLWLRLPLSLGSYGPPGACYPWRQEGESSNKLSTAGGIRFLVVVTLIQLAQWTFFMGPLLNWNLRGIHVSQAFWRLMTETDVLHSLAFATGAENNLISCQLSYEKKPGCLGFIGDEILPSYMGILINHCKDPH